MTADRPKATPEQRAWARADQYLADEGDNALNDLPGHIREVRSFDVGPTAARRLFVKHLGGWLDPDAIQATVAEVYGEPGPKKPPAFVRIKPNNTQSKIAHSDPTNLALACAELGVGFRYNRFKDVILVDGLPGFPELTGDAVNRICFAVHERFKFLPGEDLTFRWAKDEARKHAFDPVVDYFNAKEFDWDGTKRIDRFLVTHGGAEDTPFNRAVSRLLFVAVVRRNREPGCKFDEMVVLESEQGKSKSSALAMLAVNEAWFTDSFPLDGASKEVIEQAHGKIIIEVAELQGMRRGDIEDIKSNLSRTTDRARMAYAPTPVECPRRFVFVGTTNGTDYLQDLSGNRRFWPVAVQQFDLAAVRRDLDQLWAEAASAESSGESIRLDEGLWEAARVQQDRRLAIHSDPFTVALSDTLGHVTGRIASADVWRLLGVDTGRQTPDLNRRMGAAMRSLGWKRCTLRIKNAIVQGYAKGTQPKRLKVELTADGFTLDASVVQPWDSGFEG